MHIFLSLIIINLHIWTGLQTIFDHTVFEHTLPTIFEYTLQTIHIWTHPTNHTYLNTPCKPNLITPWKPYLNTFCKPYSVSTNLKMAKWYLTMYTWHMPHASTLLLKSQSWLQLNNNYSLVIPYNQTWHGMRHYHNIVQNNCFHMTKNLYVAKHSK